MTPIPNSPDAYKLLHDGSIALAAVESNGFQIDMAYLERAIAKTHKKIKRMTAALDTSDVMREWRRAYGRNTNIDSPMQLGDVLFNRMGYESPGMTRGRSHKTDKGSLESVDHPFVHEYLLIKKLKKAASTNLVGIRSECVDGLMHCFYSLNNVVTYRSASQAVNFQNQPIRDPDIAKLVRRAFIARPGRQLVEIDFKSAEVCVGACYHRDPRMIEYVTNKKKDMHRDMAVELFLLPPDDVPKPLRHFAKNRFVFAEFYGDWYISIAPNIWKGVCDPTSKTADGVPLLKHMRENGIRELGDLDPRIDPRPGTFESHLKKIERSFWDERFRGYKQWKIDWYEQYTRRGWFQTLTGFVCQGYMQKNEAVNYPIQGASFHCLLRTLIRVVLKEIARRHMGALIVGQIHDSMIADVPADEVPDFVAMVHYVTRVMLRRWYPWLIVPIEIECEIAPVGGSWYDKQPYELN